MLLQSGTQTVGLSAQPALPHLPRHSRKTRTASGSGEGVQRGEELGEERSANKRESRAWLVSPSEFSTACRAGKSRDGDPVIAVRPSPLHRSPLPQANTQHL